MKTILLIGDPNVGKSVLFSRLTGVDVIASNYPGTTVDYLKGRMNLHGEPVEILDAPGTYSLEATNKAEEVAVSLLDQADVIVNVVDATSLERCLLLTVELLEKRKPVIVALNMWDEAQHLGIHIDVRELENILQVPVVPTVAITAEGIKELVRRLDEARISERPRLEGEDQVWTEVGHIVRKVQSVAHRHHSVWDRLSDATVQSGTGWLTALGVLFALFWLVRLVGEGIIRYGVEPVFDLYRLPVAALSGWLGPGFLHDVLVGTLINGKVDYVQSMGILTTGLFVPFGMVLPYIIAFYLALALLEDSGYLPRLATVTDNVFHKLGLHGHGIIPVLLGLGCNVPGVLAARTLETRKQRFIAATLVSVTVPCMAQSAMIFGVLGHYGARYILLVYGTLSAVFILLGLVLNKTAHGECPELFLDIPPYRRPSLLAVTKKTWMRVRWFVAEAVPFLFLGVVVVNILNALGIIEHLARHVAPFMQCWFGLPGAAVPALLAGFLRKDLAVGMLVPLALSPAQLTIAVTVLTLYFPCVAAFAILLKELGVKDMLKAALAMILTALLVGGILRLVLM
ncbi:MAG: ferrous iron transporter B [Verrucomicrobia bacterium]|nr:ferrous iron transporter B [Verrucomicrobiota bacterium]MCG2678465.1 ferrous iron transporter B [Kiritimatiellia bacterium]MBU4248067.1 ferrous iron transporter B [Verrucomicrobiota bacterium]MBU4290223.1 ferrous iron transporter B [Verrucomicrobiota bacterium]MBU4430220.1 ferrous iron transporter B [Verrucomicrobiota bacterium]